MRNDILVKVPFTRNSTEAAEVVNLAKGLGAMGAMGTRFLPHRRRAPEIIEQNPVQAP